MRLLIIEDSLILRENIAHGFRRFGHVVDEAGCGIDGMWLAEEGDHDVIVLDLGLPELDGMDLVSRLRAGGRRTPVLILTARDGVSNRVAGLRAGGDDYFLKPFAFDELIARVDALHRRTAGAASDVITCGGLELDLGRRTARCDDRPVRLARREWMLLEVLLTAAGRVVTREQIEARLYDDATRLRSNSLDAALSILRRAIDEPGLPSRIETLRGQGYRIRAP